MFHDSVKGAQASAVIYSLVETADGLKEGDVVIVTGNVNLAHEAPVKVIEN